MNIQLSKISHYLRRFPFWIVLFFLIRLIGITNPPLETAHNWRQVTTNMYARNFLEIDNNPFYCRVDMAGNLSGITAKEFPVFNYLIYIAFELFGFDHWYGRLINLIVSSFGLYFFYRIIKQISTPDIAFASGIILAVSIWFAFSRKIMPDTFSMSLVLGGIFFALQYLYEKKKYGIWLFAIFATIGVLSKIPSGFILIVLVLPLFDTKIAIRQKAMLCIGGIIIIIINGLWYFYWAPYIVEKYGYAHYPIQPYLRGIKEIFTHLPATFNRFYFSALHSFVAFAIFLTGVVWLFIKKEKRYGLIFSLSLFAFVVFMFKAGFSFHHHSYYIIPFVPVMAFIAGYGLICSIKSQRWRAVLLVLIAIEGIANQQHDFWIDDDEKYKLELEIMADSVSNRNDLVALNGDGNPQELYFMHRKGWIVKNTQLQQEHFIDSLKAENCKYLFINKHRQVEKVPEQLDKIYENHHFVVYEF